MSKSKISVTCVHNLKAIYCIFFLLVLVLQKYSLSYVTAKYICLKNVLVESLYNNSALVGESKMTYYLMREDRLTVRHSQYQQRINLSLSRLIENSYSVEIIHFCRLRSKYIKGRLYIARRKCRCYASKETGTLRI